MVRVPTVTSDCPSSEILAAFIDHALTPDEQARLELHLVTCRTCREIVKAAVPAEDRSMGDS